MSSFHDQCLLQSEEECGDRDVSDEGHSVTVQYDRTPLLMGMARGTDRVLEATGYRLSCFLIAYASAKQTYARAAFNYFYCLLTSLH